MADLRARAKSMLKILAILTALDDDDRRAISYELYRTYGGPIAAGPLTGAERTARYRDNLRDEVRNEMVTETVTQCNEVSNESVTKLVTVSNENGNENGNGQHVVSTRSSTSTKSSTRSSNHSEEAKYILRFLNEKAGRSYREGEINLGFIVQRLKSGASVEDCKGVIARKVRQWRGGEMEKYLRPATLFNATKFEQYVGEQSHA